ncbi:MAG: hypothetical protein IIB78_06925 [Proteobacteria bacterium]|nr:hypothetical protein [Pseudomonadota bacterium]
MKRIPENEYREEDGIKFVTKELIVKYHTTQEVKTFYEWFCGQTGLLAKDGSLGVYVWDYERWLEEGRLDNQLSHNWD